MRNVLLGNPDRPKQQLQKRRQNPNCTGLHSRTGAASRETGGFGLTYVLYASIQFEAIACWAVLRSSCPPFLNHLPAKARRTGSAGNPETGSGPFATSRSGGEKTGNETGDLTGGTERGTGGKRSASRLVPKFLRRVSKLSAKLKR